MPSDTQRNRKQRENYRLRLLSTVLTPMLASGCASPLVTYVEVKGPDDAAARSWVQSCPGCDIRFSATGPGAVSTNDLHFGVVYHPEATSYFALAFSPLAPPSDRQINISPLYFASRYDKVGLLRHELGHVLGYRHERINGVPGCALEDNGNWRAITPPDDLSVMHLTCGNDDEVGPAVLALSLTRTDVEGHQKIYGAGR
jgi:hypothetical protein